MFIKNIKLIIQIKTTQINTLFIIQCKQQKHLNFNFKNNSQNLNLLLHSNIIQNLYHQH